MPKNRVKKSKGRSPRNVAMGDLLKASDSAPQSQEEDNVSETSSAATCGSEVYNEDNATEDQEENTPVEGLEEKLKEAIDGLTEKNVKYRKECLCQIRRCFLSSWLADFLENYKETLLDGLEKCLRKGKGEEQALAAELLAVLAIQTGGSEEGDSMFSQFKQFLSTIILDQASAVVARSKCCQALGILAFIVADDMEDVVSCIQTFDTIFRASFLKGDKSVPVVTSLVSDLHNNALSSWALLLSICPWSKVKEIIESRMTRLPELLTSSNVQLRITAGETIALIYEIYRSEESEHLLPRLVNKRQLVEDMKELATDSNKYRAKKDRRQQRSNFRDVVRSVETGMQPEDHVKFGAETLYMYTWTAKRQYTTMKDVLATGMNLHLKENMLLREIFQLGPPITDVDRSTTSRGSHFERHLFNQAVFKARSKARGKLRDKRTAFTN
ncbi:interferon-related developmental regulator 2-like [Clavelina lepadiformis]|uniref:interferon-related developmental regulator 2-like n=1 Tax=Clavelina lepadiformis TaxID=159417 RepID=UPI00404215E8